ncbi:ADP-ribosylglycohydrolase family protein [Kitasatospora sp. NPDC054939]
MITTPTRDRRTAGAVVGSAVGDALGAPFEFGPPGVFSARFPGRPGTDSPGPGGSGRDRTGRETDRAPTGDDEPGSEMRGGGWEPGEATDDTQMAVLVAHSLLEHGGLDLPDVFDRFRRWAAADPKDIGIQTEEVLTSGLPWDRAAARHFQVNLRAAGNGALMRATTSAVRFAREGREAAMEAARRLAALTHGDRAAWEGTAVYHELLRLAFEGRDPLTALPEVLAAVHPLDRPRYAVVLAPDWHPEQATEFNGAVWPCLGSAAWALRTTGTFEGALRAAIDLGGDTDTVAAVTGGLAGARYGLDAIPERWTAPLHVPLPGPGRRILRVGELVDLAHRLDGR